MGYQIVVAQEEEKRTMFWYFLCWEHFQIIHDELIYNKIELREEIE